MLLLTSQTTPFTQTSTFLRSLKQPSYTTLYSEIDFKITPTPLLKMYYLSPFPKTPLEDSSDNGPEGPRSNKLNKQIGSLIICKFTPKCVHWMVFLSRHSSHYMNLKNHPLWLLYYFFYVQIVKVLD